MNKKTLKIVVDAYREGALAGRFRVDHLDLWAIKPDHGHAPTPLARMNGDVEVWRAVFAHDYSGPPYATFVEATGDLAQMKEDLQFLANRRATKMAAIVTKRFAFSFTYGEDETVTVYTFTMSGPGSMFLAEDFDKDHLSFCEDMERYGVHDFGIMKEIEFIGFGSYEIEPALQPKVVGHWRDHLTKMGYVLGETEIMSWDDYEALLR